MKAAIAHRIGGVEAIISARRAKASSAASAKFRRHVREARSTSCEHVSSALHEKPHQRAEKQRKVALRDDEYLVSLVAA
jgi:hypothetical protein